MGPRWANPKRSKPTLPPNKQTNKGINNMTNQNIDAVNFEIRQIGPDEAKALLETNTRNRKIKQRLVAELSRAMSLGDWQFNGDPIRIGTDGRILDGQHRLSAIYQSKMTIPVVVISGVDPASQITMDVGAKRSFSDHLRLVGEQNAARLASITRSYAVYQMNVGKDHYSRDRARISGSELLRVLDANPKLRQSTYEAGVIYEGLLLPLSVIGCAHRVLSDIDADDAAFFFTHLRTGNGLSEEGRLQPLLRLRNMASSRRTHERRIAEMNLGAIFKTWNAYRAGTRIGNPLPRIGGANPEMFPWPK